MARGVRLPVSESAGVRGPLLCGGGRELGSIGGRPGIVAIEISLS